MIHLRQLGPAFLRHVEAYGRLAGAALRDTGGVVRRRAALLVVGLVLAIAFVTLAAATAIAAAWGSPYRWWVAAGILGAIAIAAGMCLARGAADLPRSSHLQALRDEWQKDKDWLGRERGARASDASASLPRQGMARAGDVRATSRAGSGA